MVEVAPTEATALSAAYEAAQWRFVSTVTGVSDDWRRRRPLRIDEVCSVLALLGWVPFRPSNSINDEDWLSAAKKLYEQARDRLMTGLLGHEDWPHLTFAISTTSEQGINKESLAEAVDFIDAAYRKAGTDMVPVPAEPAIQGEYLGKEPDEDDARLDGIIEQANRLLEQAKRLDAEKKVVAKLVAAQPGITLDNVATVIGWSHQQAAAALERAKLAGRVTARGEHWYPIPISR